MTSRSADGEAAELAGELLRAARGVDELARHARLRFQNEEFGGRDGSALAARDRQPDSRDARVEFRE